MRKIIYIFILFSVLGFSQTQQRQDLEQDLENVVTDLIFLSRDYISPAAEGVAYQTTNGWVTTAEVKKPWEVTLSLQGSVLFLPSKYQQFSVSEATLRNLTIQGAATSAFIPTALGGDDVVVFEGNLDGDTFEFTAPEGVNEPNVKHAQLQANVSLLYGTELVLRYSPKIKINDTNYQTYGFGLHHSLSQWFSSDASNWHFSTLIYYSNFNLKDSFSSADFVIGTVDGIKAKGNSLGFNLIGTKNIGKLSVSTMLNVTTNNFDYEVAGEGELLLNILNGALENLSNTETYVTGNLGLEYHLKDFSVNSSLSFGKFSNINVGINYTFSVK